MQRKICNKKIRFEVPTAVVMKSTTFWDIKPCSPLKVNRRFGGTNSLQFQVEKKSLARNQLENRWRYVPPKRRLTLNGLHGVIFQKMVLFIY
jgi:hypothetical protein